SVRGPVPGLRAEAVLVGVYRHTASGRSLGAGVCPSLNPAARGVCAVTPSPTDLAAAPGSFTISGNGFANLGVGLPVVNFVSEGRSEERRVGKECRAGRSL